MKEERIKEEQFQKAFAQLEPDEKQQERVFMQIERKKKMCGKRKRNRVLTSAAVIAFVLAAGFLLDVTTGGNVMAKVRELMGMDQKSEELVKDTMNIRNKGICVYAPELFYCSESEVVFGSNRGLLIYDRNQKRTVATIDLQDTDCQYFNSDPTSTKVLVKKDTITLFNVKKGTVTGTFYQYEIPTGGNETTSLTPTKTGKAEKGILTEWNQVYQDHYVDTFEQFQGESFITNQGNKDEQMYSEDALIWQDEQGEKFTSCLLSDQDGTYSLCTRNQNNEVQTEVLEVNDNGDGTKVEAGSDEELPKFSYQGEDKVLASVCNYMIQEEYSGYYETQGQVYIPSPVIYQSVEKGDELLVFGNFWSETYALNGKVLECTSGGEMPACMHMKKTDQGYQVTSITVAEDGSDYEKSIEAFTEGYPDILNMFQDDETTNQEHLSMRKAMIRMYITQNNLDVTSYKDYGWDPVSIEE